MNKLIISISCGLTFITALTFTACIPHQKNETKQDKKAVKIKAELKNPEEEAVKLVMDLDEVKRKTAAVERDSKGKRTLVTYVETPPTNKDPYYWVKVTEDNGGSLVTYYIFAVHGKTHSIGHYDDMQDSLISLAQWRKTTPAEDR